MVRGWPDAGNRTNADVLWTFVGHCKALNLAGEMQRSAISRPSRTWSGLQLCEVCGVSEFPATLPSGGFRQHSR